MVRNRNGERVDIVPFVVVSGLAVMLWYSFGPLYLQAYGVELRTALWLVTGGAVATIAVAYWWFVYRATAVDIPSSYQAVRIYYALLAFGLLLIAITLPLL